MITIETKTGEIYKGEISGSDFDTLILRCRSHPWNNDVRFVTIRIDEVNDVYID